MSLPTSISITGAGGVLVWDAMFPCPSCAEKYGRARTSPTPQRGLCQTTGQVPRGFSTAPLQGPSARLHAAPGGRARGPAGACRGAAPPRTAGVEGTVTGTRLHITLPCSAGTGGYRERGSCHAAAPREAPGDPAARHPSSSPTAPRCWDKRLRQRPAGICPWTSLAGYPPGLSPARFLAPRGTAPRSRSPHARSSPLRPPWCRSCKPHSGTPHAAAGPAAPFACDQQPWPSLSFAEPRRGLQPSRHLGGLTKRDGGLPEESTIPALSSGRDGKREEEEGKRLAHKFPETDPNALTAFPPEGSR